MGPTGHHHLVLDDDPATARWIEQITETTTVSFASLPSLLDAVAGLSPVAAFIDIHLGTDQSGLEVIPSLRQRWPQAAIFVVTADPSESAVEGALAAGADDFLKKPIQAAELKARLHARLAERAELAGKQTLRAGDLTVQLAHRRISAHGKDAYLSSTALNLLVCLLEGKGASVPRDVIKRRVWGRLTLSDNALDHKVYELRRSLQEVGSRLEPHSVYGQGYRLSGAAETEAPAPLPAPARKPLTIAPIRVLLIEDNDADAVLVKRALTRGDGLGPFDLQRCDTLAKGVRAIEKGGLDLILLDLSLPDSRGLETFTRLSPFAHNLPIVILSGLSDDAVALQAVASGAHDFLSKDEVRGVTFPRTIRYALSRFRNRILETSALRARQKELEEVSNLKSQFLANMSHEIRTPMNAVIGMASLLAQSQMTKDQLDCVETIRVSSEHLLHLINEILDFSKFQSGKVELEETSFRLRPVVEGVVDLFSAQACEKGLSLGATVEPAVPPKILGDPTRLHQVLVNLVGNAVKFTSAGKVNLEVGLDELGEGDSRLHFRVKDTGIGIAEEERPRLFEVFGQANLSTTKRFGGTGLGLAISKKIVELMGGTIGFDSRAGKGTTFFFDIPCVPGEVSAFDPRPDLSRRTVLVQAEVADQREFLVRQLIGRGMRVESVEDEARLRARLTAKESFDLIISAHLSEARALSLRQELGGKLGAPLLWIIPKGAADPGWESREVLRYPYRQSRLYEDVARLMGAEPGRRKPEPAFSSPRPLIFDRPVLVAEDNPINQKVLRHMLSKLGVACEVAANGLEAVRAVERTQFSAILMDCSMPELDGWAATERIRASGNDIPILAMTANAFKEDEERCYASGMNQYLAKPVTLEQLQSALGRLSQPAEPAFDRRKLLERIGPGADEAFARELMELFLEVAPATQAEVKRALSENETERLRSQAHRLKGLALNVGAERLAAVCAALEEAARAGDLSKAQTRGAALEREWSCLMTELKAEVGPSKPASARGDG